jgi:hypothetical protein
MTLGDMPETTDLIYHPQLAIVVALEITLVAAMRSLLAAHPEIFEDEFPRTITQADFLVDRIVFLGCQLQEALMKYRLDWEECLPESRRNPPKSGDVDF